MSESETETRMRLAAVEQVERASAGGVITSEELRAGFYVDSVRIPLINPQRGIFKPATMRYLLSVRTVSPRTGARVWYDDQRAVHPDRAR
jgi:putative restriction endonuclease